MQHTEDENGIWTHAYVCRNDDRIWYVTLVGTFYKTERLAKRLIAEQIYRLAVVNWAADDLEGITVERCERWLDGLHHMDPGSVTMVSSDVKVPTQSARLRSQVLT